MGLVARDRIVPISARQDTVGSIARTVKDAAYLLTTIAGHSTHDNETASIPLRKSQITQPSARVLV